MGGSELSAVDETEAWCEQTGTVSLASLMRYARGNRRDWFAALCNPRVSNAMLAYLRSAYRRRKAGTPG